MSYFDSAPATGTTYEAAPLQYTPYGPVHIEATGDYAWAVETDKSTGQRYQVFTSIVDIVYPEMACRVPAELLVGTMVSDPDGQSRRGAVIVHEDQSCSPLPEELGRQLVDSMPLYVDPDTPEGRQARADYIKTEADVLDHVSPFYAVHYADKDWPTTDQPLTTPPPTTSSPSYSTAD